MLRCSLSLPPLGKMEIIASFHGGGALPSLRVQLKLDKRRGVSSSLKALYHSGGNRSLPGDLLAFYQLIAASSSLIVNCDVMVSFCISPIDGRSSELRKRIVFSSADCGLQ